MDSNSDILLLDWLFASAGPIVRWRLVADFDYPIAKKRASDLQAEVLATEEVRRWLNNLGGRAIHMYQGAHMGLGENRRKRDWIEIESTFRVLNIQRLMKMSNVPTKRSFGRASEPGRWA